MPGLCGLGRSAALSLVGTGVLFLSLTMCAHRTSLGAGLVLNLLSEPSCRHSFIAGLVLGVRLDDSRAQAEISRAQAEISRDQPRSGSLRGRTPRRVVSCACKHRRQRRRGWLGHLRGDHRAQGVRRVGARYKLPAGSACGPRPLPLPCDPSHLSRGLVFLELELVRAESGSARGHRIELCAEVSSPPEEGRNAARLPPPPPPPPPSL